MPVADTTHRALANDIINRVELLIAEADAARKPLEIDPYREQLFELFVVADAAGLTDDDAATDLSADGICRSLSERWGLASAARESFESQSKLPPAQLAQMRALWSVMRMWMEWTYAWRRWPEFHGHDRIERSAN